MAVQGLSIVHAPPHCIDSAPREGLAPHLLTAMGPVYKHRFPSPGWWDCAISVGFQTWRTLHMPTPGCELSRPHFARAAPWPEQKEETRALQCSGSGVSAILVSGDSSTFCSGPRSRLRRTAIPSVVPASPPVV